MSILEACEINVVLYISYTLKIFCVDIGGLHNMYCNGLQYRIYKVYSVDFCYVLEAHVEYPTKNTIFPILRLK